MFSFALWRNNLVRGAPFAKKISEDHEVIYAGPLPEGKEIFGPYRDFCKYLPIRTSGQHFFSDMKKLMAEVKTADLLHSFKVLPQSYIPALFFKYFRKLPLVVDLEDTDWDPDHISKYFKPSAVSHALHPLANTKIVHTSYLQNKYGGEIIRTGTDTEAFKPKVKGAADLRKELDLEDKFVLPFLGGTRRYKGTELILEGIRASGKKDAVLLMVGNQDDPDFAKIYPKFKDIVKIIPARPFSEMPKFLAMSDMVALPQLNYGPWCVAQMPAKIYDAMSAAKPILTTNVGDFPDVLGDTGFIIDGEFNRPHPDQDEIKAFADKFTYIHDNPKEAKKLGKKAREKCIAEYDWNILKQKTLEVYRSVGAEV